MNLLDRALLIETSGRLGEVGLLAEGRLVVSRSLEEARRHARDLAAITSELLEMQKWKARYLTSVVVSLGPGSFTGLRVGLASAKALAFAVGCPLLGVPTFHALAAQCSAARLPSAPEAGGRNDRTFAIIADALQGQAYVQRFILSDGGTLHAHDELSIRPMREWIDQNPSAVVTGPGVCVYQNLLLAANCTIIAEGEKSTVEGLLRAVIATPDAYRCNVAIAEPIYLRGSSAEEKLKQRG